MTPDVRWLRRASAGAVVALLGITAGTGHAAPITLFYDALGRLIGVSESGGDTSRFEYDAVGNVLSISRYSSATVSIIRFSPAAGPAGTTLTIQGTGFGATPGENTVTVNSTAATVSAASPTELTVTVPAGAPPGSGPIAVTAPGGSATSATPFTVTTTSEAPTITGFTPALADRGAAVTIEGTQFEPTPLNNKVTFNARPGYATVTAATSTALTVTVPTNATSGRVTLATPGGQTTSSADFFVPPTGATAAQTVFTGRLTIGGSSLTFYVPANKFGLVVFDGTAGQRVDLGFTGLTTYSSLTVYRPDGTAFAQSGLAGPAVSVAMVLPVSGTYAILATTPYGGNMTLTVSEEVTATIAVGGAPVTVAVSRVGQRARVEFAGTTGQRLSVGLTATGLAGAVVSVLKPDATTLSAGNVSFPGAHDMPALPVTGTYAIIVDPTPATGTVTLTLSEEVAAGTIVVGGPSVPVSITRGGQRARLTFEGTAGQRLSLGATNVTIANGALLILKPDVTSLASGGLTSAGGAVDIPALPVTGTYAIVVDPSGVFTGDVTLTLSDEVTGSITLDGTAVSVNIPRPGQRARLTFAGTASQRVSVYFTGTTFSQASAVILYPNDNPVSSQSWITPPPVFIEPVTLPTTTTYAILIDPVTVVTGQTTVAAYNVPGDVSDSLTINGGGVPVTLTVPGQKASLTFAGTSGQSITIAGSGSTLGCTTVWLTKPSGTFYLGQPCGASFSFAQSLTATGNYTLQLDPAGVNTGSVTVTVTSP